VKRIFVVLLLLAGTAQAETRFAALDVYIDAAQPLAAWQFELSAPNVSMTVVGVENGDSEAFGDAPYYDREAIQGGRADRIIVADYSTSKSLPSGRFRLATIHVMIEGGAPEYELKLITAKTGNGWHVDASITVREQGADHEQT